MIYALLVAQDSTEVLVKRVCVTNPLGIGIAPVIDGVIGYASWDIVEWLRGFID